MKKKFSKIVVFALTLAIIVGIFMIPTSAFEAYDTYTYSIDGEVLQSPTAYSAFAAVNSSDMGLSKPLNGASDVNTDSEGNVYIADATNNRIVVLDKYYKVIKEITGYYNNQGDWVNFNEPRGVYITDENKTADKSSFIFVCDSKNKSIAVFDRQYNYVRTIIEPVSPLLEDVTFEPQNIAVDIYGRIFIVSEKINEGIMVLSGDGEFTGFIGAQKVTSTLIQRIWRKFQTREQRQATVSKVSVAFNNITVDDDGFVYATTDKIDATERYNAIKSKSADFSPVKKLNSTGVEIMNRNGFFDPSGEVGVFYAKDASRITEIALGPEGSWTILDVDRSRMFTYDQNGNLLFAFGDKGNQLGNGVVFEGLCYQEVDGVYYMLLLEHADDGTGYKIMVYAPSEYCDTIIAALHNENQHKYDESIECWTEVLTKNNNFDLAYIGIGKALFNQGKYSEAREYLEKAYETETASKAFEEQRKDIINKWILLIAVGAIGAIVGVVFFLGYAKKKNKATSLKVGKKTYWEELLYVFHLCFHPFDGFWDLKHEKRGSVRAASTIIGLTVVAFFYQAVGKGYLHNPRGEYSILASILLVIIPIVLWVVSNWCLTTLFDGEGSFKDIYIATGYSLAPLPLFVVVSTVLTNVLTVNEGKIISLITAIGFIWVGILLFFGMQVTHDYSMGKNILIIIFTIVAMLIIMFVVILFGSLVVKMITFIISLVTEIGNRV